METKYIPSDESAIKKSIVPIIQTAVTSTIITGVLMFLAANWADNLISKSEFNPLVVKVASIETTGAETSRDLKEFRGDFTKFVLAVANQNPGLLSYIDTIEGDQKDLFKPKKPGDEKKKPYKLAGDPNDN